MCTRESHCCVEFTATSRSALAVLWLSQALTGLLMVFRWELDDAPLAGARDAARRRKRSVPASPPSSAGRPGARSRSSTRPAAWRAGSTCTSTMRRIRHDLVRVDGAGEVLRTRSSDETCTRGFIPTAATLHQTLFAGDTGKWIVGLERRVAAQLEHRHGRRASRGRTRAGQWRAGAAAAQCPAGRCAPLCLAPRGRTVARRARAACCVGAGVLHDVRVAARALARTGRDAARAGVGACAHRTTDRAWSVRSTSALARFPTAELSGAAMPTPSVRGTAIRVRQPDEWRRVYGTTVVYVSAVGRSRAARRRCACGAARPGVHDNLYPIHTGEAAGLAGRLLSLAVGLLVADDAGARVRLVVGAAEVTTMAQSQTQGRARLGASARIGAPSNRCKPRRVTSELPRTLSALNLVLLGIGCIVGAGIYVLPGIAAAHFAGPGVMLSFLLAGAACALAALCYAELASTMPVSGSAYAYCYAAIGEVFAWSLGWLLLFEYGIAAALLGGRILRLPRQPAARFRHHDPGRAVDAAGAGGRDRRAARCCTSARRSTWSPRLRSRSSPPCSCAASRRRRSSTTSSCCSRSRCSAASSSSASSAIEPANWVPLVPPNEGGFAFGWQGVVRAASILFFAYIGFETVSTAAAEARNPQRDLPIGILGSLAACTIIYIVVAAVLTGIVPYRELGVPDPIALAIDRLGMPVLATLVKVGALAGPHVRAARQRVRAVARRLRDVARRAVAAAVQPAAARACRRRPRASCCSASISARRRRPAAAVVARRPHQHRHRARVRDGLPDRDSGCATRVPTSSDRSACRSVVSTCGGLWIGWVPLGGIVLCLGMAAPVAIDVIGQALRGQVLPRR